MILGIFFNKRSSASTFANKYIISLILFLRLWGLTASFPLAHSPLPVSQQIQNAVKRRRKTPRGQTLINHWLQAALFWKFSLRVNVPFHCWSERLGFFLLYSLWSFEQKTTDFCYPKSRELIGPRCIGMSGMCQSTPIISEVRETRRVLPNTPLRRLATSFVQKWKV